MSLNEKITDDLKAAMKARDTVRVSCLRMLKTAVKNKQVEKRRPLKDREIEAIISSLVKKGEEAALEFKKGGREELAAGEEREVRIFYEYLPRQLDREAIEETLKAVISELSASGPRDMGKVMKTAMARMAGQAQGKKVSEIAGKLLAGS